MSGDVKRGMICKDGNAVRPYTLHVSGEGSAGFHTVAEAKKVARFRYGITKWRKVDMPTGARGALQAAYLPLDGACAPWYREEELPAELQAECERLREERTPTWDAAPLDDDTLHYIACEIDHDIREHGVGKADAQIRWSNRAAGMLLATVRHYQSQLTAAQSAIQAANLTGFDNPSRAIRFLAERFAAVDGGIAHMSAQADRIAEHFDDDGNLRGDGKWRLDEIYHCAKEIQETFTECVKRLNSLTRGT
jgi:hypothetical protein